MTDYKSNKTCREIDAILDSATPKGTVGDAPDTLSLQGARTYSEVLSRASLICAGQIIAPHTILGDITIGAEVEVTDAFRLKFGENNPAVTKVVLVDKRVAVGEGDNMDTRYIYSGDYEGCYFVMGNFKGNDTIFGLDAIEGDWVIAQNKQWTKIVTKQREISDLDAIRRGAGKGDTSVQGVVVNNKQLTPDGKGNISLPKIPAEIDIANMGFTKNEGTVTGVMVNGESKSPNSAGVVDLGEIKVDEVKFANDLTGVVEATPEMFTFRPSAGDKSVRDESAVIRRIKGNTSIWGQLADSLNPITNSGYVLTRSTDNKSFSITRVGSSATSFWCAQNLPREFRNASHKYLFVAGIVASNISATSDYVMVTNFDLTSPSALTFRNNGAAIYSVVSTPLAATTSWQFAYYAYGNAILTVEHIQAFDLTAIFGVGNEPTTYNEFRKYYPDAYYPYCAPEVRSMRATGIETIGFNAFNGEYAEVIGGQTYYLGGIIDAATFAVEKNGERIDITIPENRLYTPSANGYIYATGRDICINLSHSGVRNGEYKPYEKNTLLLPEIVKYFPEGMNGIGDVFDEINEDIAVKRFGVVDLGTLTWNTITTNTSGVSRWQSKEQITRPTQATSEFPNIVCIKYATGTNDNTYAKVDCISVSSSGTIRIFDSNYTTGNSKDAFVASLQGVLLYYELAVPIYTPIDEPLQLDYKVADFGTEKMLSDVPSSPFKADIVYQFNAEGRIRDNSRNIERLEELVKQPSDWLEENPSSPAYIKNKPSMPTAIAPVTEVIVEYSLPSVLMPNVIHEVAAGLEAFTMPPLYQGNSMTRNVYKMVFVAPEASKITFPYSVCWRDGVAPNWANSGDVVELTFTTMAEVTTILGEWKLYKL